MLPYESVRTLLLLGPLLLDVLYSFVSVLDGVGLYSLLTFTRRDRPSGISFQLSREPFGVLDSKDPIP